MPETTSRTPESFVKQYLFCLDDDEAPGLTRFLAGVPAPLREEVFRGIDRALANTAWEERPGGRGAVVVIVPDAEAERPPARIPLVALAAIVAATALPALVLLRDGLFATARLEWWPVVDLSYAGLALLGAALFGVGRACARLGGAARGTAAALQTVAPVQVLAALYLNAVATGHPASVLLLAWAAAATALVARGTSRGLLVLGGAAFALACHLPIGLGAVRDAFTAAALTATGLAPTVIAWMRAAPSPEIAPDRSRG